MPKSFRFSWQGTCDYFGEDPVSIHRSTTPSIKAGLCRWTDIYVLGLGGCLNKNKYFK